MTMKEVFFQLTAFFAADASVQLTLIQDFEEEKYFDMAEGHLATYYPLLVLSITLRYYAERLTLEAGGHDYKELDPALCSELSELMALIVDYADGFFSRYYGTYQGFFWKSENLSEKMIWNSVRRLCKEMHRRMPDIRLEKEDVDTLLYVA